MASATNDRNVLRYVSSANGAMPTTPALKTVRMVSEDLNFDLKYDQSKEMRPDRTPAANVKVDAEGGGNINFELSCLSFDDFIEACLCGTWATGTVANGTTSRMFAFQRAVTDATTPYFVNYTTCMIESMSLSFKPGEIITGQFGVSIGGATTSATQVTGATFPAATTTDPMTAVSNITTITENGSASTMAVNGFSLEYKNNIRRRKKLQTVGSFELGLGGIDLGGDIEIYVADKTLLDRYLAGTTFSYVVTLGDGTNTLAFNLPKIKLTAGKGGTSGRNSDHMFSGRWTAEYDSATSKLFSVIKT